MGKRARKTRWRALDIADDHSDSEESNTNSSAVSSRYSRSNSNGYHSRYSYSSQSTPARRRYNQYDGSTKSTRSSSTTSENKITFNEDEYTRITTPRQDVLFKKGYLNKPKNFQTQTSTGNSTISTGNSTENGTPDHQSADLDYESQFMFPNGFVDQNGIYYVNSYEPYPLMLFNPPTYYQEFSSNNKSKRYSTGSLSESMSPNNEEATSQDLSQSGGEASNSGVSDYSGGPPVFNMIYPGYYVNDAACTPPDLVNGEPVKKLKKRRERKSSKNIPGDSSEYTDENSGDEQNGKTETSKTADFDTIGCSNKKTELKPDAEEFVPRAYQPMGPAPPQINFMPIPLVPIGAQNFAPHPAFIPPGIPINFIPHHLGQKIFPPAAPGFVGYLPEEAKIEEIADDDDDEPRGDNEKGGTGTTTPSHTPEEGKCQNHSKTIDIATVVSKLEAVKQQEKEEPVVVVASKPVMNESKPFKAAVKSQNFNNKNYYNKYRNSPVRSEAHSPIKSARNNNFWMPQEKKHWKPKIYQNSPKKSFPESITKPIKEVEEAKSELLTNKPKNQWIPVSSRKKKKNKNFEDFDNDANEESLDTSRDLFETYDVSQLVDVVPPSQLEEKRIEDILINIAKNEVVANAQQFNNNGGINIPEVSDIEKAIVKLEEEVQEIKLEEEEEINEDKPKKRSKKGTQKPLQKKVIITDIFIEPETPLPKKLEEVKPITSQNTEPPSPPLIKDSELEKKSKKKKKNKTSKPLQNTINNYDILENSRMLTKTNDEISLELDKLIQQGMYNSLQEKIKSINIETDYDVDVDDDFFKTLNSLAKDTNPSSATKTPDFNRIFQSTRQFLKPNMVSVEHDNSVDVDKDTNKSCSSTVDAADPSAGPVLDETTADKKLYPITQAVREWMSKTREATPEVEILKSPSAIQKEFGDDDDDDDDDEEVTLFSFKESVDEDLLEYWENDLPSVGLKDCDLIYADGKSCDKCRTDTELTKQNEEDKEEEEEIEVYKSKYGENEAFLQLQREMKERQHCKEGPYRAVCCSLQ